jgi:hypothetical protein
MESRSPLVCIVLKCVLYQNSYEKAHTRRAVCVECLCGFRTLCVVSTIPVANVFFVQNVQEVHLSKHDIGVAIVTCDRGRQKESTE